MRLKPYFNLQGGKRVIKCNSSEGLVLSKNGKVGDVLVMLSLPVEKLPKYDIIMSPLEINQHSL